MSNRINHLCAPSKWKLLAVFILMFGGLSIYAFVGAFRTGGKDGKTIKPQQVKVPKYFDRTNSELKKSLIIEADIIRINRFKKYMDSIRNSTNGKREYDSIIKSRPALMDSIKMIEEIYYSNSK